MEQSLNSVEWYMKLLAPLSPDIKLDLISRLSESLKKTVTHSTKTASKSENIFSALSGAWEDDDNGDGQYKTLK